MPRISMTPAGAVLSLLLLASTASAQVPFEPLITVGNARVFSPKTELVNSPAELASAWIELGLEGPPPSVDFARHSVVIYFAGMLSTGGPRFEIRGVGPRGGALVVDILESGPTPGCGGLSVVVPAFAIMTIPWHREARTQVTKDLHPCGH